MQPISPALLPWTVGPELDDSFARIACNVVSSTEHAIPVTVTPFALTSENTDGGRAMNRVALATLGSACVVVVAACSTTKATPEPTQWE